MERVNYFPQYRVLEELGVTTKDIHAEYWKRSYLDCDLEPR